MYGYITKLVGSVFRGLAIEIDFYGSANSST